MREKGVPISEFSDRKLLVKTVTDLQWVKKTLSNHLKHHERYEIALVIGVLLLVIERVFFN